MLAKRPDTPSI